MCSSPKPRTKVKGKKTTGGSILANISPEARSQFSARANLAQERRSQMKLVQKQKELNLASINKAKIAPKNPKGLAHRILTISLKDIFYFFFVGKSKPV